MSILFFYCLLFQFVYYRKILYSFLRTCFHLLILGSLYMPKIILTILKKVFWIIKGETMLVCLLVKPLGVLVLLLALTSLFVHSSIFVLIFRKGQPNLLSHHTQGHWIVAKPGGEKDMDSPVAQLVEHSKLNWEILGSFPGWGVLIFFLQARDCQRHLLSLL